MSGIVGYVGVRPALEVVLPGLHRLAGHERGGAAGGGTRGHGCAGVALLADGGLATARTDGGLTGLAAQLQDRPPPLCTTGVGQLGTPGTGDGSADRVPHPQVGGAGSVAVAYHGALTNGAELRGELAARGRATASGTDAEAVAHLLAETFSAVGELGESLALTAARLRGAYALAALHADEADTLVAAGRGLPMLASVGDGEAVLATEAGPLPVGAGWRLVAGDSGGTDVLVLRRVGDDVRDEVLSA